MIFDGHSDIWTDVTTRLLNGETNILKTYHLDKLKQGNISGSIFVIWIDPPHDMNPYKRTQEIMSSIVKETESCSDIAIVKSFDEINIALQNNKFFIIIGLEGLSSIGNNLSLIDNYYDFGARHASLTWNEENLLATGVKGNPVRGLTALGKEAYKKIISKNMIFDVSHLNEKSFWDIIDIADKPIIASHSNSKSICDVPRNLTDNQLKEIQRLGGIVGINSFNQFVHEYQSKQTVETLVDHIIYMANIMGIDHVGLGFDFCDFLDDSSVNSFSNQETSFTKGLEDCSKTLNIVRELSKRGFSQEDIEKISYKNFFRIIKETLV